MKLYIRLLSTILLVGLTTACGLESEQGTSLVSSASSSHSDNSQDFNGFDPNPDPDSFGTPDVPANNGTPVDNSPSNGPLVPFKTTSVPRAMNGTQYNTYIDLGVTPLSAVIETGSLPVGFSLSTEGNRLKISGSVSLLQQPYNIQGLASPVIAPSGSADVCWIPGTNQIQFLRPENYKSAYDLQNQGYVCRELSRGMGMNAWIPGYQFNSWYVSSNGIALVCVIGSNAMGGGPYNRDIPQYAYAQGGTCYGLVDIQESHHTFTIRVNATNGQSYTQQFKIVIEPQH